MGLFRVKFFGVEVAGGVVRIGVGLISSFGVESEFRFRFSIS